MEFDELIQAAAAANGTTDLIAPAGWGQGRTTFGGLVAAMIMSRMRHETPAERMLQSAQVAFVGPVVPEQPFNIRVEKLREGKAATLLSGRAIQGGAVSADVQACFGSARESSVVIDTVQRPAMAAPEQGTALPYIPGVTPEFTQQADMVWTQGGFPFSGSEDPFIGGWMRLRNPSTAPAELRLFALADVWPPAVLPLLKKPSPTSSVTWNYECVRPDYQLAADEWLFYRADVRQAANGYGHTEATIWTRAGELLALSRQLVVVYD